ncbi:MAG: exodeoxyribonuclease VII large subunit [Planctomycetota bacterium]
MGRLPFNAKRDRKEDAAPARGASGGALSVRSLAAMIDDSLRVGLPSRVMVEGEVSGFRERTHWYFDLKDADAVVSCVVFASSASKLSRIADGDRVVVHGRVEFYAKAGRVSLIATRVEHVGEGAQDAALRRLVEEIRGLGWLDLERKRRLPSFPMRIAVVTSRSAAALQDVLTTLDRRCRMTGVLLADAPVQGDAAPRAVAARIDELSRRADELGIEAVIVTRGGGSAEDLAAFNDRDVARAIVRCSVPVVAAIGHETDTTIAELVADVRAATPTQAAVLVAPDSEAIGEMLDMHASRLSFAMTRAVGNERARVEAIENRLKRRGAAQAVRGAVSGLESAERTLARTARRAPAARRQMLDRLELRLGAVRPDRFLARRQAQRAARLADASARLKAAAEARLIGARRRAAASARELHAVGPAEVLRRGYSVTLGPDGSVLRSVKGAPAGTSIETRLADGSVRSVVGGKADLARAPRKTKKPPRRGGDAGRDQLDLFDRAE